MKSSREWLEKFSLSASLLVFVLGTINLSAWAINRPAIVQLLSPTLIMNPMTGLALLFLGVSLWHIAPRGMPKKQPDRLVTVLAVATALIGAMKLIDYVFGINFDIERLVFPNRQTTGELLPGEIAPNTALNFLLCGLALLLLDKETPSGFRPAQGMAVVAGLIALLALIGYSYRVLILYTVRGANPMTLGTAIGFMLFSSGVLAARPHSGVMSLLTSPTPGGAVARRLLPMAVLIPWVLGGWLLMGQQHGHFETDTAVSTFAVTTIVLFSGLIWRNAKLLHLTDIERRRAEEQVRRASLNLERSNTDLQQFAYVASHDLFEPLRMVTSYLQLLKDRASGKLDEQSHEFIGFALDGAQRMRDLINDLLEYSRVEIRGRPFVLTDANQVLNSAMANLKVAIEESGARIQHEPLPRVLADEVQLTQVFQNLIGNAIKFRNEAPPQIDVSVRRNNGEWQFSVHDNGIGIEPQYFERVFVIFQRLHTRQEYAGTGMGLAICKKIIERHGGRIWVESQPGKGSRFNFTIPVVESAESKPDSQSQ